MDGMWTAPAGTTVDAPTSDGRIVAIRPVRPGDRNRLAAMFRDASADSLVPMTDLDAGRMWRDLRGAPLLTGYRGSAAVDTAALEEFLLRVGRLAEDFPEIAELDLGPVLAGPGGVVAVDAKLRQPRSAPNRTPPGGRRA